jgi:hypothetical protein
MKLVRTARVEEAERYLEAHERERKLAQILKRQGPIEFSIKILGWQKFSKVSALVFTYDIR